MKENDRYVGLLSEEVDARTGDRARMPTPYPCPPEVLVGALRRRDGTPSREDSS